MLSGVFADVVLINVNDPDRFTSLGLHLYSNFRDLSTILFVVVGHTQGE